MRSLPHPARLILAPLRCYDAKNAVRAWFVQPRAIIGRKIGSTQYSKELRYKCVNMVIARLENGWLSMLVDHRRRRAEQGCRPS